MDKYVHVKNSSETSAADISMTGKVMSIRHTAKIYFIVLKTEKDQVPLVLDIRILGENHFNSLSQLNIGTMIRITGHTVRSDSNETSVFVHTYSLVSDPDSSL